MYSTGYDFVKMAIQVAVGKEPELLRTKIPFPVEVKFITTEKDIEENESQIVKICNGYN